MEDRIRTAIEERKAAGLYRRLYEVEHGTGCELSYDGKVYVNFSSNDYLGLSAHPDIIEAMANAAKKTVGTASSRLMTGSTGIHRQLEDMTARFKGKPAGLLLTSGYQANVGVISALCGKGDAVFSDRLNHASIIDGIRLSGAKLYRYRHNDTKQLEDLLIKHRKDHSGALIVTETLFSMDGDRAPIKSITRLKEDHDFMFMVDEAHATGVFGLGGSGMVEEEDVIDGVDLIMGTFSKALGGFGAYIATSTEMKEYLVNECRSFVYTTSLPEPVVAADIEAINVVGREPYRRRELMERTSLLREGLRRQGFTLKGDTQIVPLMTASTEDAVNLCEYLRDEGFWTMAVRPPTVPEGSARVRLSMTSDMEIADIERFLNVIKKYDRKEHV